MTGPTTKIGQRVVKELGKKVASLGVKNANSRVLGHLTRNSAEWKKALGHITLHFSTKPSLTKPLHSVFAKTFRNGDAVKELIRQAVTKPSHRALSTNLRVNGNEIGRPGAYIVRHFKQAIGVQNGEACHFLRVLVDYTGRIVTAYPATKALPTLGVAILATTSETQASTLGPIEIVQEVYAEEKRAQLERIGKACEATNIVDWLLDFFLDPECISPDPQELITFEELESRVAHNLLLISERTTASIDSETEKGIREDILEIWGYVGESTTTTSNQSVKLVVEPELLIHQVKKGESLSSIAMEHSIPSWEAIYEHPLNSAFRVLRPDYNKISVGDRIAIPKDFTPTTRALADGDVVRFTHCSSSSADPDILFVNGMRVDPSSFATSGVTLACITGKSVKGIYNHSAINTNGSVLGSVIDALQCVDDWIRAIQNQLREDIGQAIRQALQQVNELYEAKRFSFHTENNANLFLQMMRPEVAVLLWEFFLIEKNAATFSLFKVLAKNLGSTQRIVAHSQGNLITANALWAIQAAYGASALSHIHVYSLASPVPAWPNGLCCGRHKVYGFNRDCVTWLDPKRAFHRKSPGHWKDIPVDFLCSVVEPHDFDKNVFTRINHEGRSISFADLIREDLGLGPLGCCVEHCSISRQSGQSSACKEARPFGRNEVDSRIANSSPQSSTQKATVRSTSESSFLVEGDEVSFEPMGGWAWSPGFDGIVKLEVPSAVFHISGRKVATEEDVIAASKTLEGQGYEFAAFRLDGSIAKPEMSILQGRQNFAKSNGKRLATDTISGTFTVKLKNQAKTPKGDPDLVLLKTGRWKIAGTNQSVGGTSIRATTVNEKKTEARSNATTILVVGDDQIPKVLAKVNLFNDDLKLVGCGYTNSRGAYVVPRSLESVVTNCYVTPIETYRISRQFQVIANPFYGISFPIGTFVNDGILTWLPEEARTLGGGPIQELAFEDKALTDVGFESQEALDWIGGVLAGDFSDELSISQIVVRTTITMVPVVDQLADAQDLIAALYKLLWRKIQSTDVWLDLAISIVGCVPTLGTAAKGVLKMVKQSKSFDSIVGILNKIGFGDAELFLKVLLERLTASRKKVSDMVCGLANELQRTVQTLPTKILGEFSSTVGDFAKHATKEIDDAMSLLIQRLDRTIKQATPWTHRVSKGAENSVTMSMYGGKRVVQAVNPRRALISAYEAMFRSKFRRQMRNLIVDSYPRHPLSFLLGDRPERILADLSHPLRKVLTKDQLRRLANPTDLLHKWLSESHMQLLSSNKLLKHGAHEDYKNLFVITTDAGHGTGKRFLDKMPDQPQRFYLEDSFTNRSRKMDSTTNNEAFVMKRGAAVDGVWVEETTLQMWRHYGYVGWDSDVIFGGGWIDHELHNRFAIDLVRLIEKSNK